MCKSEKERESEGVEEGKTSKRQAEFSFNCYYTKYRYR